MMRDQMRSRSPPCVVRSAASLAFLARVAPHRPARPLTDGRTRAHCSHGRTHPRAAQVVVLVEGIDSVSSKTVQCRHSYTAADIVADHQFAPCTGLSADGTCSIDFGQFHQVSRRQFPMRCACLLLICAVGLVFVAIWLVVVTRVCFCVVRA